MRVGSPANRAPIAAQPAIPLYGHRLPTVADVLDGLRRVTAPDRVADLWTTTCRATDISDAAEHLSADQLDRVATALIAAGGTIGVFGNSVRIRTRAYARLLALSTRTAGVQ